MTELDFTKPLAFASDPYTVFPGPFIGPDVDGDYAAIHDGEVKFWEPHGKAYGKDHLVPLQVQAEAPPKWLQGVAEHFDATSNVDYVWGAIWPSQEEASGYWAAKATPVQMIDIAAPTMLAAEIESTVNALATRGQSLPALSRALKLYKERLA